MLVHNSGRQFGHGAEVSALVWAEAGAGNSAWSGTEVNFQQNLHFWPEILLK